MASNEINESRLNEFAKRVEKYIIKTLIALMSVLLIIATLQLAYEVVKAIVTTDGFLIDMDGLMQLFGVFLLVLIGIELLDTIKVYFKKHVIHVEVVMLVAIIAIARKVIVMDFDKYSGFEILGIAGIIVALAGGYFLIKKTGGCDFWPSEVKEKTETILEEKTVDDEQNDMVIERKKIIKTHISESPVNPGRLQQGPQAPPVSRKGNDQKDES